MFNPNSLRAAFGRFLTGLTMVTTRTADGPQPDQHPQAILGLSNLALDDPARKSLLARLAQNPEKQSFDLYVGDETKGDILPASQR